MYSWATSPAIVAVGVELVDERLGLGDVDRGVHQALVDVVDAHAALLGTLEAAEGVERDWRSRRPRPSATSWKAAVASMAATRSPVVIAAPLSWLPWLPWLLPWRAPPAGENDGAAVATPAQPVASAASISRTVATRRGGRRAAERKVGR